MLTLTALLHEPVLDVEGRPIGHARELIADAGASPPEVTGMIVGGRRVALGTATPLTAGDAVPRGDLLLVRDLLDVQVLDRSGRHRGRVGEVELGRGSEGALVVSAVETGLRPVLARLGLRRLARRAPADRIPWAHLHPQVGRAHAFSAELHDPPRRFHRVMRARRRPPR